MDRFPVKMRRRIDRSADQIWRFVLEMEIDRAVIWNNSFGEFYLRARDRLIFPYFTFHLEENCIKLGIAKK